MEFRQLEYFVKVASIQHVTQAAEEMHVSQSAVSRQIHQLEEELGVTLFVQRGRNVQLTSAGRLFLRRVQAVINDLDNAVREVRELLDPDAGEIRLGFPHSLGITILPSVVAEFRKIHPNVKFKLRQGTYSTLMRDLLRGEIDLTFISPFPGHDPHVSGEIVMSEEMVVILPPDHRLANQQTVRLQQLKDEPFVMFSEDYSLRSIVWNACLEAGFKPMVGFEGEETDTIRGMVAAGMGVSLLPEMALIETSPLMPVKVRLVDPQVKRTIGLIRRSETNLPLVAEVFRCFMHEHFGMNP